MLGVIFLGILACQATYSPSLLVRLFFSLSTFSICSTQPLVFPQASKSSESLANESLSSYLASEGTVSSPATKEASLFPEGSTVLAESYYFYDYDNTDIPLNNCPSDDVIENPCRQIDDYEYSSSDCYFANPGYPSTASPSVNDCIG